MTTIAQGSEILKKAVESGQVKPATPPTAYPIPSFPPEANPLLRTPMPASAIRDSDTVRQFHNQSIPQTRILIPSSAASPTIGASAQTISQIVAQQAVAGSTSGITSVSLTMPSIFSVAGSPGVAPSVSLAVGLLAEGQNTVFAGPGGTALDQVDAITTGFGGSPASLSATPTHSGDLALVITTQDVNTGTAFNPGAPWSFVIGAGTNKNIYKQVVSGTTSVTAAGPTGSAPAWDGVLMLLGAKLGFTPTVVNSGSVISGAFGSQTNLSIPFTPTAGNTLLFVWSTGFANFAVSPNLGFFSDSVGDIFTVLAQSSNSGASGTKTVVVGAKSIVGGATTVSFAVTGNLVNGSVLAIELSNLASISTVPAFRFLVPADIPPINLAQNNVNGGVTGILGRGNLPTQVAYTDVANVFTSTQRISTTSGPNLLMDGFGSGAHSQFDVNANAQFRYDLSPFGAGGFGVLTIGGTQTFPILVLAPQAATTGDPIQAYAPGSTTVKNFVLAVSGKISNYNGIATVSDGVPAEYATIDLTAQAANIGATTLYAVPATGVGMYRVSAYVVETTAGSVSSTLPNVQIVYTDQDTSTSITIDATPILGVAGIGQTGALTSNTVGTASSGVIVVSVKASTTIQYQTVNYASTAAGMQYALHIKLEAL